MWCVLSCGDLIEFERACGVETHQVHHRIGMAWWQPTKGTVSERLLDPPGSEGAQERKHGAVLAGTAQDEHCLILTATMSTEELTGLDV